MSQFRSILTLSLQKGFKTTIWILKIILPISLFVSILDYLGVIAWISELLLPVFTHVGLPGESAIVFISSIFLSLYAPIAIISTLTLTVRELTILAVMCLITHNSIIETAVQHKTGTPAWKIWPLRFAMSFFAAFILNLILPQEMGDIVSSGTATVIHTSFWSVIEHWAISSFFLVLKIILIITALMLIQDVLKGYRVIEKLSKTLSPFMRIFGLKGESAYLWIVAQIIGLTYGSAILVEETEQQQMDKREINLFNYHIAINHSILEDNTLFVLLGASYFWMSVPRLLLAIAIVWAVRGYWKLRTKFTRVETTT